MKTGKQSALITSVVKRQCDVMGMAGTMRQRLNNYHKASAYQHVHTSMKRTGWKKRADNR